MELLCGRLAAFAHAFSLSGAAGSDFLKHLAVGIALGLVGCATFLLALPILALLPPV